MRLVVCVALLALAGCAEPKAMSFPETVVSDDDHVLGESTDDVVVRLNNEGDVIIRPADYEWRIEWHKAIVDDCAGGDVTHWRPGERICLHEDGWNAEPGPARLLVSHVASSAVVYEAVLDVA